MKPKPIIIWVDDDNAAHEPLRRYLVRKGFNVKPLATFADGLEEVRSIELSRRTSDFSLLLDVILPRTSLGVAVVPYLGLDLALEGAKAGIQRICFLTVVQIEHARNGIESLNRDFPDCRISYEDKMALLDRETLHRIVAFLSGED